MAKEDLNQALQKKADQLAKATEAAVEYVRDWQQIKQFLKNRVDDIELTAQQQEKLKRYNTIYSEMQGNNYSDIELPCLVAKLFNVKLQQAYRDIAATKELYSTVIKLDKLFEVRLRIDHLKILIRKCEEMQDMEGVARLDKNLQKYLAMLPDDENKMDENFTIPQIIAVFNPQLLGIPVDFDMQSLLKKINEKHEAKLNTELFDEAEIADEPATD